MPAGADPFVTISWPFRDQPAPSRGPASLWPGQTGVGV